MVVTQQLLAELNKLAPESDDDTLRAVIDVLRQGQGNDVRRASVTRSLAAVSRLVEASNIRLLGRISSAPTDIDALYRLLNQPESAAILQRSDPLAPARMRALRAREELLNQEGGTISSSDVATLLGISRQAVDDRRKRGALLGVQLGRRGYRYPVWQFASGGTLPGLRDVLAALRDQSPWIHLAFMLNRNAWLDDRRPLDLLREGDIPTVVDAASRYGEQGAA